MIRLPLFLAALLAAPAAAATLADKSPLLDFSYAWPDAAAIPKLDARFRADARTSRQRALNAAREDRAARAAGVPFSAHALDKSWTVAGDAAGLLSLRGEAYAYTGGAHGNSGFEAILWDRKAGRDIALWRLFRDEAAARALLARQFCPALEAERAEKRDSDAGRSDPLFSGCPRLAGQILVPGAVRRGHFTAIDVLIAPYEAGPYSEGTYEVRLRVTPALVALLRPERKAAFGVR